MRIAVNASAAKLGGILTYFSNLLPELERMSAGRHDWMLYVPSEHVERFRARATASSWKKHAKDILACLDETAGKGAPS